MFEFIKRTAWLNIAAICGLNPKDVKQIILDAYKRILEGKADLADFSPNIQSGITFYAENIDYLNA